MSYAFCITGRLSDTRDNIKHELFNLGHQVKNSMSKNVDYLVLGTTSADNTHKIERARELGIPIINEIKMWNIANNNDDYNNRNEQYYEEKETDSRNIRKNSKRQNNARSRSNTFSSSSSSQSNSKISTRKNK